MIRFRWHSLAASVLLSSTASAQELSGPDTFHPAIPDIIRYTSPEPFLSLFQVGGTLNMIPALSLGVKVSQPTADGYESTLPIRTPCGFPLTDLYFRTFALDLTTNTFSLAGPLEIPIAQGERVYQQAQPGLFAVEMEYGCAIDDWMEEFSEPGFTGPGYLIWRGTNWWYRECTESTIHYKFEVEIAGEYALAIHSYHTGGDQNNDVWIRTDDQECFKVYSNVSNRWTWATAKEPTNGGYKVNLDAGVHTISFSARSANFAMDRFHLFHTGSFSRPQIENSQQQLSPFFYE